MTDEQSHYVAVTAIIRKGNKFLICKRSPKEYMHPNKWCVPGGKIEKQDFVNDPKDFGDYWVDIFAKIVKKEVKEETNLEITNIGYIQNYAFIRPNGISTIIVSLSADYASGEVELEKEELTEYAWVTLEEAKDYDLIEGIYGQIKQVSEKA